MRAKEVREYFDDLDGKTIRRERMYIADQNAIGHKLQAMNKEIISLEVAVKNLQEVLIKAGIIIEIPDAKPDYYITEKIYDPSFARTREVTKNYKVKAVK